MYIGNATKATMIVWLCLGPTLVLTLTTAAMRPGACGYHLSRITLLLFLLFLLLLILLVIIVLLLFFLLVLLHIWLSGKHMLKDFEDGYTSEKENFQSQHNIWPFNNRKPVIFHLLISLTLHLLKFFTSNLPIFQTSLQNHVNPKNNEKITKITEIIKISKNT